MCVTKFNELCNKYRFYNFDSPDDYDKWIDYNWDKIKKEKYSENGLMKNETWIPTYWQWYWLK